MEVTIKSLRIIKEGTQEKSGQPYKWMSVMVDDGSEKGTEYTTFDAGVLKLGPGSVIDIGDPVTKEGKLSFKKIVKVVSEVQASEAPGPGTGGSAYKRDTEAIRLEYNLKAYLQQVDRISIECQTSLNRLIELVIAEKLPLDHPRVEKALAWAESRFDQKAGSAASSEATGSKSARDKTPAPGKTPAPAEEKAPETPSFPHVGALLKWCAEQGISRPAFMTIIGVKEEELARVNIDTAYTLIKDHLREHSNLESEIFGSKE